MNFGNINPRGMTQMTLEVPFIKQLKPKKPCVEVEIGLLCLVKGIPPEIQKVIQDYLWWGQSEGRMGYLRSHREDLGMTVLPSNLGRWVRFNASSFERPRIKMFSRLQELTNPVLGQDLVVGGLPFPSHAKHRARSYGLLEWFDLADVDRCIKGVKIDLPSKDALVACMRDHGMKFNKSKKKGDLWTIFCQQLD